jgi:hypothetical protein
MEAPGGGRAAKTYRTTVLFVGGIYRQIGPLSRRAFVPTAEAQAHRPPVPCRFAGRSRPTFQTCPQFPHRQYDDASAFALVVVIVAERQNGQVVGAGTGAS